MKLMGLGQIDPGVKMEAFPLLAHSDFAAICGDSTSVTSYNSKFQQKGGWRALLAVLTTCQSQ